MVIMLCRKGCVMEELKDLIEKIIRELKGKLNGLINNKNNLSDPEIINVSKELDEVLNEYERIKRNKK